MNDWIGSIAPTQKLLQHSCNEIHKETVCLALTYFNGNINMFFSLVYLSLERTKIKVEGRYFYSRIFTNLLVATVEVE